MAQKNRKLLFILLVIIGISLLTGVLAFWAYTTSPHAEIDEERPDGTVIATGVFNEMSGSLELDCHGKVDLILTPDNTYVLYFYETEIDSEFGDVLLSEKTHFDSQFDEFGVHTNLGDLPYQYRDFSLSIPADVNATTYHSVVIANRFSDAIIGYAKLLNP